MNVQRFIREIRSLKNIEVECPCCGSDFVPSRAVMFDATGAFPSEAERAIAAKQTALRTEEQRLKQEKEKLRAKQHSATDGAEKKAVEINLGLMAEKLVTGWEGFPHEACDCCPLFEPIDYVAFDGLNSNGALRSIAFIDIKTANSRLTKSQRLIAEAILDRRVEMLEL